MGITRGQWCREVGLSDSTVSRWRTDTEPNLMNMKVVADGLGRPLIDILIAAGYLDPKDVRGRTVTPRVQPDAITAIQSDPTLTEIERDTLLQMLAAMRQVASGATGRSEIHRRATRRRPGR